jgi:hypothetical protein
MKRNKFYTNVIIVLFYSSFIFLGRTWKKKWKNILRLVCLVGIKIKSSSISMQYISNSKIDQISWFLNFTTTKKKINFKLIDVLFAHFRQSFLKEKKRSALHRYYLYNTYARDSVAQLVARLTPDQKVACSSHVGVKVFFLQNF